MSTPLDEDTNFQVIIQPTSLDPRGSMAYRYEIYNANDNPDYSSRYGHGYGRNRDDCERKARKEIKKLLRPYLKKPELSDFIPAFFKRIM